MKVKYKQISNLKYNALKKQWIYKNFALKYFANANKWYHKDSKITINLNLNCPK